jgi:hypothetical protein
LILLQLGSQGPQVEELIDELRAVGFPLPVGDVFDATVRRVVMAYQADRRLGVDGRVVYRGGETWPALVADAKVPLPVLDQTPRAVRLSALPARLWDGPQFRMRPEYRASSTADWYALEKGQRLDFPLPLAADGSGRPGATCGHAAWLLMSWWFRAIAPAAKIFPTFQTGRGPDRGYAHRMLPLCSMYGEVMSGFKHFGLAELVAAKYRVRDLPDLVRPEYGQHQWYYCQRDSGHVVTVLLVTDEHGLVDPRTGLPARLGAYRFAADGSKATTGQPWTFKRIVGTDPGEWTAWGFVPLDADGQPPFGPFRGQPDYPLVLA